MWTICYLTTKLTYTLTEKLIWNKNHSPETNMGNHSSGTNMEIIVYGSIWNIFSFENQYGMECKVRGLWEQLTHKE